MNVLPDINLFIETDGGFKYSFELQNKASINSIVWKYFGYDKDITQYLSEKISLEVGNRTFSDDFPRVFYLDRKGDEVEIDKPFFTSKNGVIGVKFNAPAVVAVRASRIKMLFVTAITQVKLQFPLRVVHLLIFIQYVLARYK